MQSRTNFLAGLTFAVLDHHESLAYLKIAIVALSLGLDVFAICVGVGMRGVERGTKMRIGIAFASAEIMMTLVGVALGAAAGKLLGDVAGYVGFSALVGLGAYMIFQSRQESHLKNPLDLSRGWGLMMGALSISLDSLGIGFSILYIGVPLYTSLAFIGVASVGSTILGLRLGKILGRRAEEGAELWAGVVLLATGVFFIALKVSHVG
ncbi:MAG: manganese efflux pump MntP family protein [Candidatus Eremiobacteraeota bacterium]|nr:manganese efflux pump MntP family protein [Candidatus Eremiobacteraeota bacterium]